MNFLSVVIVPGGGEDAINGAIADPVFMGWLRRVAQRALRKTSVCSGALLLGAAGLLSGKRVTTDCSATDSLQQMHPNILEMEDTLYINDGDLWTSAGVLSGVDMALALVTSDLSPKVPLAVARMLVVYLIREGGSRNFRGLSIYRPGRAAATC